MDLILAVSIFWATASVSVYAVSNKKEVCYPEVGCFNLEPPWVTSARPLPAPESPDKVKLQFYLTTRNTKDKTIREWRVNTTNFYQPLVKSLKKLDYQSSRKRTVIHIHGMYHNSKWNWEILKQLATAYMIAEDVNIIFVEYDSQIVQVPYNQLVANVRVVGVIAARFIEQLMQWTNLTTNQIHIIGFSMGGHVAGYIGKRIPRIYRITGLDPAQPQFENADPRYRLHRTDADNVDVLHTNIRRFIPYFGLGYASPLGKVDFYFNAGFQQPGCDEDVGNVVKKFLKSNSKDAFLDGYLAFICSHVKVIDYWAESLTNVNCTMWGIQRSFRNKKKNSLTAPSPNHQRVNTSNYDCVTRKCAPVGLDTFKYVKSGRYDVPTQSSSPYCVPRY